MEGFFLVIVVFMCSLTHFKVGYLWMHNWEQTGHKKLEEDTLLCCDCVLAQSLY